MPFIMTMPAPPDCVAVEEAVAVPVLLAGSPSDDDTGAPETRNSWWQSAAAMVAVSLGALVPFSNRRRRGDREQRPTTLRETER